MQMQRGLDRDRQESVLSLDAKLKEARTRILREVEKCAPTERSFLATRHAIHDICDELAIALREVGIRCTIPSEDSDKT